MFHRVFLALGVLTAGLLFSAHLVLDATIGSQESSLVDGAETTLVKAPISIGNPAAAATLLTRRADEPRDSEATLSVPSYKDTLKVGRGDTLSGLLRKAKVPRKEASKAVSALAKVFKPNRIRQGQKISIYFQPDVEALNDSAKAISGRFLGLSFQPDYAHRVDVLKDTNGEFRAVKEKRRLTRSLARADNIISSSLFVAGRKVDIPNAVLADLIRLYSWDVDFQRDIRKGDSFEVMFERLQDENDIIVHNGDIVYASLTLSGKRHAVYRHTLANGDVDYFDEKGKSAKKALMRTPIDGARLSSGFGRRKHPILGYTKMHKGLDFAAPRGTPIYAAGNGSVEYAGRKGAYGKYIRIRHNSEYSTAYAHMSRIATGKGRRVKQGQIIGYVGTTGRSTGPHLHYEILRGGRQMNPMRVKMPSGKKLKGKQLEAFQVERKEIERLYAEQASAVKLAQK